MYIFKKYLMFFKYFNVIKKSNWSKQRVYFYRRPVQEAVNL